MDVSRLQARTDRAREGAAREKLQLLTNTWRAIEGEASDKAMQRVSLAREQLLGNAVVAADQGKDGFVLLRLSYQSVDLRHALQAELHKHADKYPTLRSQGPPSFGLIEQWLEKDLKVSQWENVCPMHWLMALDAWLRKPVPWFAAWLHRRPKLPPPLQNLWAEALQKKLKPRFEFYRVREDEGIALLVSWKK